MKVEIANVDDLNEILELQVRAYQSEAEIYDDYSIELYSLRVRIPLPALNSGSPTRKRNGAPYDLVAAFTKALS